MVLRCHVKVSRREQRKDKHGASFLQQLPERSRTGGPAAGAHTMVTALPVSASNPAPRGAHELFTVLNFTGRRY